MQDPTSRVPGVSARSIRRVTVVCLHGPQGSCGWSVFEQIFAKLRTRGHATDPNWFRWLKTSNQWWKVKFKDEGVIDAGGGFRESVSTIAEELMSDRTPLFVPVPDAEDGISFHRCASQGLDFRILGFELSGCIYDRDGSTLEVFRLGFVV